VANGIVEGLTYVVLLPGVADRLCRQCGQCQVRVPGHCLHGLATRRWNVVKGLPHHLRFIASHLLVNSNVPHVNFDKIISVLMVLLAYKFSDISEASVGIIIDMYFAVCDP